ncbi:adenylyl-sulfate kinase [Streptomyces sioyaensis]|uniref:adenylyl-sulfate kinase n=1 Tax=Streptomyces sioyaensis TaxID=67364 RepID=UPI003659A056
MKHGVVWITGLSGVGKSTVARLVADRLTASGKRPVLLDGDRLREILPVAFGYETADRRRLALFYAQLAHQLAAQGHLVVCSTISLLHEVHDWNRRHTPGYVEVWLRAPIEELRTREGRAAFYGPEGADAGSLRGVVGVDTRAEFPRTPDLVIDNHGETTAEQAADLIMRAVVP